MGRGYKSTPTGVDGIAAKFADHQRQMDALRATAGILSAIIRGKDVRFETPEGDLFGRFGSWANNRLLDNGDTVPDALKGVVFYDPAGNGVLFQASVWGSDGATFVQSGTAGDNSKLALYRVFADDAGINANFLNLNAADYARVNAPRFMLAGIPSVGSPDYSLGYDFDGTDWSVVFVTSAAKYKQDIKPAEVDPDAVLAIEPVTFRDKASAEKDGDAAKTNFGVIADQLHELGLGELLVTYNEAGEVEAAKYDRIGLALLPVLKRQQAQIDALTARLDALEG